MKQLFDFLIKKDVEYKRNQPMSQYTSVRIGGCASVIAFPRTQEQFTELVRFLRGADIKYKIIGRMTNILPCDDEYRGVLVSTRRLDRYTQHETTVIAECGVLTSALILRMAHLGLGGAEALFGIPGTIGGMTFSNAGAYGFEIGDMVMSARLYSCTDDRVITLTHEEMQFSYRKSILKGSDMILLTAELCFNRDVVDIILEKMGKIRQKRANAQPLEQPSLGSVFKRLNGMPVAPLIDQCGLKGLRVGGAQVSPKHAGFIVNLGDATAADFTELISKVKHETYMRFGVTLEEEIEFL